MRLPDCWQAARQWWRIAKAAESGTVGDGIIKFRPPHQLWNVSILPSSLADPDKFISFDSLLFLGHKYVIIFPDRTILTDALQTLK